MQMIYKRLSSERKQKQSNRCCGLGNKTCGSLEEGGMGVGQSIGKAEQVTLKNGEVVGWQWEGGPPGSPR